MSKLESIKEYNLKTVMVDLNEFDVLAKESDFLEISEWKNGDGWDIKLNNKQFELTHGQLEAINTLTCLLK